jgi:hypothetical protein
MAEEKARQEAPHKTTEQRIADLELQLAQTRAGLPGGTTPEHAAGPGTEVAETWSLYEQEQSKWEADNPTPPGRP